MDPQFVWAVASIYYQSYRVGADAWVTDEIHDLVLEAADDHSTVAPLDTDDALDVINLVVGPPDAPELDRWAAGRAIVKLFGANLLDLGNDKISALFEALHLPHIAVIPEHDRLAREIQAEQFLLQNRVVTCGRTLPGEEPIVVDLLTATLTLNSTVQVQKSLAEVAKALDPQSWPTCSSEFFEQVFVIPHQNYEYPKDQRPPQMGVPQTIGGTWNPPDLIYEKFVIPGYVSIENVLGIKATFDAQAKRYDLCYWLDYSWYSKFGMIEGPGGLSVDNGFARASEDGTGGTIVTARKILGFQDRDFPEQGPLIPGVVLMASTAGLMEFSMDHMFLQAICCAPEKQPPETVGPPDEEGEHIVAGDWKTGDDGSEFDHCGRYVDTWLGFWRKCANKLLDDAATQPGRVGDKRSRQVVNQLTDEAFNWWSDALHLWVDAGHRCFDTGNRAANTKSVAALSFFATNDRNQVTATLVTRETDVPSVLLAGYDGKNRSAHLTVRFLGDGRAEVTFKPAITGKNGRKVIPDGIYHGVVLKANSLQILATVYVLKIPLKKTADSAASKHSERIDDVQ